MEARQTNKLEPYISPLGAWALALGTSIGWGSLVVTSNAYLSQAGPLGSIAGILIGAAVSCGVEQLQYLHLLGTVEVDDVICNTLGALMGAQFVLIAPIRRRFFKNLSW